MSHKFGPSSGTLRNIVPEGTVCCQVPATVLVLWGTSVGACLSLSSVIQHGLARGWIQQPILRIHLQTRSQVSPADCQVHLSDCCRVPLGGTFRSLHGWRLCRVTAPHFLLGCNSLKLLADCSCRGRGRRRLFVSPSVAVNSAGHSDCSKENISGGPLGWSRDRVCVCVCAHLQTCL